MCFGRKKKAEPGAIPPTPTGRQATRRGHSSSDDGTGAPERTYVPIVADEQKNLRGDAGVGAGGAMAGEGAGGAGQGAGNDGGAGAGGAAGGGGGGGGGGGSGGGGGGGE